MNARRQDALDALAYQLHETWTRGAYLDNPDYDRWLDRELTAPHNVFVGAGGSRTLQVSDMTITPTEATYVRDIMAHID